MVVSRPQVDEGAGSGAVPWYLPPGSLVPSHRVASCSAKLFSCNVPLLWSSDPPGGFPHWSRGLLPNNRVFSVLKLWGVNSQMLEGAVAREKDKCKQAVEEEQKKIRDLESHLRSLTEVSDTHWR